MKCKFLKKIVSLLCFLLILSEINAINAQSFEKIVFGTYLENDEEFEDFVKMAKKEGATHINISGNLPRSF